MLKSLIITALMLTAGVTHAQYTPTPLFGHVPPQKDTYKLGLSNNTPKLVLDSTVSSINTVRMVAASGYEFGSTAVAGLGVGYSHLVWNTTSKVYEVKYAAGVLFWMTGTKVYDSTSTTVKLKPAFGVGPFVTIPVLKILNTPFQVAYVYNWTIKKWEPIAGFNFIFK